MRSRRPTDGTSALSPPILKALAIALIPVALVFSPRSSPPSRRPLLTEPLAAQQWLACLGLAGVLRVVVEGSKVVRRRRHSDLHSSARETVVAPARFRSSPREIRNGAERWTPKAAEMG